MNKFGLVFLLTFFLHNLMAQTNETVLMKWVGVKYVDFDGDKFKILQDDKQSVFFVNDVKSPKAKIRLNNVLKLNESSLKIVNVKYDILSGAEMGGLNINFLPVELEASLSSLKSRDIFYNFITFNPFVIENGIVKKVVSFDCEFETNLNSALKLNKFKSQSNSVLSSGEWFRFPVSVSGAYKITAAYLQSLGFNTIGLDPKKIKIFGNGGRMLPLTNNNYYPIDLQEVNMRFVGNDDAVFSADEYFVFYAEGIGDWNDENKTHLNLYADKTYYYVTSSSSDYKQMPLMNEPSANAELTISTYDDYQFYELDRYNPVRLGRKWFADDFGEENKKTYSFNFLNIDVTKPVYLRLSGVAAASTITNFSVKVSDKIIGSISFGALSSELATKLKENSLFTSFTAQNSNINLEVTYNNSGVPSAEAYLDYISLKATSLLKGNGKQFHFRYEAAVASNRVAEYAFDNAITVNEVWDITDIYNISRVVNNNQAVFKFKAQLGTASKYLAVNYNDLYTPALEKNARVTNQNIKGEIFKNNGQFQDVDYLIIAPNAFQAQAIKLANIHQANANLKVKVVTLNEIYHEFSSGKQDIGAIRNFIKYVYDNASSIENKLKYVCLFGGASFDYKDRIPNNTNLVPVFHSVEDFSVASTFMSDDFYGLMDENEGNMLSKQGVDVAVGRMVFSNALEAEIVVQKVLNYYQKESFGKWRNDIVLVSDDVDKNWEGKLQQGIDDIGTRIEIEKPFFNIKKIHCDSYVQETSSGGERYPEVRKDLIRAFENGSLIINYFGHGGEDGLAHERILEKIDVQQVTNPNALPLMITATCEFSRFDNPFRPTAGEYAYLNPKGGAISLISTTRQIGVDTGLDFNENLIESLLAYKKYDYPSMAEALRLAKNKTTNDVNTVSFIGDPALKLSIPKQKIILTHINDLPIGAQSDTLKALSKVKLKGVVTDVNGNQINEFNGSVSVSVFDKSIQTKTLSNDNTNDIAGKQIFMNFEKMGDPVFKGNATVKQGVFEVSFVVPKDIKIPVGKGRVSFYGKDENNTYDYTGSDTEIKIGDINTNASIDNTPPKVKLFMNNDSFVSGGIVNTSPVLLAHLEDENGINTSGGIGHDIVAYLDGDETKPYVLNDFYETSLDNYQTGKLNYKFTGLSKGLHTLQFKAWDVYNNPVTSEIQFFVTGDESLTLDKVLNYPNPFINYTEFWFNHNKPNEPLDVQIQIFTVSGKLVKTINQTVISSGFLSRDIQWDGLDDFGDKLGKGVYVYKLSVKATLSNQRAEKYEKLVVF